MKQTALALNLSVKKTRKHELLEQMEKVVLWAALVKCIAPFQPEGKTGWPPFSLQSMLRIHFMQLWFTSSDSAMEEDFFDTLVHREFAGLNEFSGMSDESTRLHPLSYTYFSFQCIPVGHQQCRL